MIHTICLKLARLALLENEIREYFGFQERWRFYPISDDTQAYWFLAGHDKVVWSTAPFTQETVAAGRELAAGFIPHGCQPLRRDDFTAIPVDWQSDSNAFLMIFDNARECRDEELKALYAECW